MAKEIILTNWSGNKGTRRSNNNKPHIYVIPKEGEDLPNNNYREQLKHLLRFISYKPNKIMVDEALGNRITASTQDSILRSNKTLRRERIRRGTYYE